MAVLKNIYLKDFRLFKERKVFFKDGVNIIYGKNGSGKTTILEAIYYLNYGRSFRTRKLKEISRKGGEFSVFGVVEKEAEHSIFRGVDRRRAIRKVDNKKAKLADILNIFFTIFINSERIFDFFKKRKERRRVIDFFGSGIDTLYINDLLNYNKSLRNKNVLLKKGKKEKSVYDVWTDQLFFFGGKIRERRKSLVSELNSLLNRKGIKIVIMENNNTFSMEEEFKRKKVMSGPHLDDIIVEKENKNIFIYGSKGIWKMAYFNIIESYIALFHRKRRENPILLIDDFDSDLDNRNLLESLDMFKIQSLLAFVNREYESLENYNLVEV